MLHRDMTTAFRKARAFVFAGALVPVFAAATPAPAEGPAEAKACCEAAAADLAYVPTDAAGIIAVRPATLTKRPEARPLLDLIPKEGLQQAIQRAEAAGVPLDGMERLIYVQLPVGLATATTGDAEALIFGSSGLIIRSAKPFDTKRLAAAVPELPTTEASYAGRTYYRIVLGEKASVAYFLPDDHTLIVALESNLFRFITRAVEAKAEHPWSEPWKGVADRPLAVAVDVGFVRGLIAPAVAKSEAMLFLAPVAPLWEEATTMVLGIKLDGGVTIDSLALCGTDEGSTSVAKTSEALLTLARNSGRSAQQWIKLATAGAKADDPQVRMLQRLVEIGSAATKEAVVTRDGKIVRFRAEARFDVAGAVQKLTQARR